MGVLIRTTKPEYGNPFYNKGNGGVSTCIYGNTNNNFMKGRLPGLNVLPNCVGFAAGAYNETFHSVVNPDGRARFYFSLNSNACRFLELAKGMSYTDKSKGFDFKLKDYILTKAQQPNHTPTVGGIMVWGPSPGHVAYVYKVIDKDRVCTLESNWKSGKPFIRYSNSEDRRSDDMYNAAPRYRNSGGANNWGIGGSFYYLGCLSNPVVTPGTVALNYEPYVVSIEEEGNEIYNTGKIHIRVNVGGSTKKVDVTMYYAFNEAIDTLTSSNYQGMVQWTECNKDNEYTHTIEDKLEERYERIGIILKQSPAKSLKDDKTATIETKVVTYNLKVPAFIPGGGININGKNCIAIPHIYTNNMWLPATPRIYTKGSWKYTGILNK